MKRPRALTILMWFCVIYAAGALVGILAVFLNLGRFVGGYSMGGMPVTREKWLLVAGPLVAMIALLMCATALSLQKHRRHARIIFMLILPLIMIYGVTCAVMRAVPLILGLRAVIDATLVGAMASWLLFRYKPSRQYFASLQR